MNPKSTLFVSSVVFAILWTALMLWWDGPPDTAKVIIMSIAGAIAGVLWYFGMRRFGPPQMRG